LKTAVRVIKLAKKTNEPDMAINKYIYMKAVLQK
jgi:hypothetical protein